MSSFRSHRPDFVPLNPPDRPLRFPKSGLGSEVDVSAIYKIILVKEDVFNFWQSHREGLRWP